MGALTVRGSAPRAACLLVLVLGAAAAASEPKLESPGEPWAPAKPIQRDVRGLSALAEEFEHAWAERHLEDATARMDFPVWMTTDDGKGTVAAEAWDRERYLRVVGNALNQLPARMSVRLLRRSYEFVSDDLASIHEEKSLTAGQQTLSWRTTWGCVRRGGRWWVKSISESGWLGRR